MPLSTGDFLSRKPHPLFQQQALLSNPRPAERRHRWIHGSLLAVTAVTTMALMPALFFCAMGTARVGECSLYIINIYRDFLVFLGNFPSFPALFCRLRLLDERKYELI